MSSTAATGPALDPRSEPGSDPVPDPPGTAGVDDPDTIGSRERLRWFTTLWVLAAAFHYTDSQPRSILPVLVLGLPVLLFPTSAPALAVFVAGNLVMSAMVLPAAANHTVLSLMVALAFAAAGLYALATRSRSDPARPFGERWVRIARTPVGLTLLVVYAFTVLHKLNTGFFDTAESCAGTLLAQLTGLNGLGWGWPEPGIVRASAVGTVVLEAALVVLIAVPRWRRWGLLLGVGFHAMLALASFYDFATMVFALYLLLIPGRVFAALGPRSVTLRRLALAAFAVHVVLSFSISIAGTTVSPYGLTWHTLQVLTWSVAVLPVMALLVWTALVDRAGGDGWPGWHLRPAVLLLVPALALVNGAAPYLGFKTVASYSMFSNLHTEPGYANHLLPPLNAMHVVGYQGETVTLTRVEMPQLELHAARRGVPGAKLPVRWARWIVEKPPVTVPWLELRRVAQLWRAAGIPGIRVEYLRDGVPKVAVDAITDPELAAPMSWWQRQLLGQLLAFRAIDSGQGRDACRW